MHRIQKTVPNAVVVDGRVYYKQRIGVGGCRIVGGLFDCEGDCFEESMTSTKRYYADNRRG